MPQRLFHLYRIQAQSLLHRLRHDLAGEIVVGVCSVILAATFFYVFRDFLQEQVKLLSEEMFSKFAAVGSHMIMLATALTMVRHLRRYRDPTRSRLSLTAKILGETTSTTQRLDVAWLLTLALGIGAGGYLVGRIIIGHAEFLGNATRYGVLYGALALVAAILPIKAASPKTTKPKAAPSMLAWRWRWWRGARIAHFCIAAALVCFGLAFLSARAGLPYFVPTIASYAAGLMLAIPLTFQLAADLEVAWVERSLGVSHDQFLSAYDRMGNALGCAAAILATLPMFSYPHTAMASAALAAATPALILPGVMFQIDGRRPLITIMILILVSLFIATAITAHPLSLLLVALVKYYARTTQEGRFYRA